MTQRTYNLDKKAQDFAYVDNANRRLTISAGGTLASAMWKSTEIESMPTFEQMVVAAKPAYLLHRLLQGREFELDAGKTYKALGAMATELRLRKKISAAQLRELTDTDPVESYAQEWITFHPTWTVYCVPHVNLYDYLVMKASPCSVKFLKAIRQVQRLLIHDLTHARG